MRSADNCAAKDVSAGFQYVQSLPVQQRLQYVRGGIMFRQRGGVQRHSGDIRIVHQSRHCGESRRGCKHPDWVSREGHGQGSSNAPCITAADQDCLESTD